MAGGGKRCVSLLSFWRGPPLGSPLEKNSSVHRKLKWGGFAPKTEGFALQASNFFSLAALKDDGAARAREVLERKARFLGIATEVG